MKKLFLILICFLVENIYYSQVQSSNTGVTQPVPSVSSLAAYENIPVSYQTGIPSISYPLISVPTNSKFVNINFQLSYHAGNVSNDVWTGEVGMGWSLLGQGVISREIMGDFDETFYDASAYYYVKNEFDDIYNFNIGGESGKFRVVRNVINNTFEIIKLSPYTSKIEYTRTSNTATLIFDSFTIISDEGIKYYFKDYNISTMNVWLWDQPVGGSITNNLKYRSAFYLTSISDENNNELVKYNYVKDIKYEPGHGTSFIESETLKLSKIDIKDRGSIEFNYDKTENLDKKNDKFSINAIVVKDNNSRFIKKYRFDYDYNPQRRLRAFKQVDAAENEIEKYKFDYELVSNPVSEGNPVISWDVLKRVKLPTTGTVEYNFDMVRCYASDIVKTYTLPSIHLNATFNQFSDEKKSYVTLTHTREITTSIPSWQISSGSWSLNFYKKEGNMYEMIPYTIDPSNAQQKRTFPPGEYYISLANTDPSASLSSPINVSGAYHDEDPVISVVLLPTENRLLRVKSIKYFNEDPGFSSVPSKIEEYEYSKFDDPTGYSGYYTVEGGTEDGKSINPLVVYKNVKVSHGAENGYTKYYFKAADTYPTEPTLDPDRDFWPHFSIMRTGLLDKKENYNSSHKRLTEDRFDYTFDQYYSPMYLSASTWVGGNFYLLTSWIRNQKITSKSFSDSGVTETISEVAKNNTNYKVSSEKMTSYDGSVTETSYLYALDKNNQKLINANMTGILLESKTIKKKDMADAGKLISKAETRYDNQLNKLPSSVISYNLQDSPSTEVTYDLYDTKGNIQQYTSKNGIPTTIIWGYNKTQPIAKIEGAKLSDISQTLIDGIVNASNNDAQLGTDASEQSLISALGLFRTHTALSGYLITTYTYDPLIGVKSITPPSGIREVYVYDTANRLKEVKQQDKDIAGNPVYKTVKEYKYNYKN
ncbi:hypothetical protein [Chryseobacterium kwangjuense]|uniref:Sugar-binding protein n=1 Tax=Chryseobacterium kwangjuense TaxID=267125 RepID=A0A135WFQ0_9FLAO|nr:hypothetical protein [Chryseobacterium kwangjuense]KXH83738.1 hypothetical protein AU378_22640 [Chryseobacterium kwangjuense]